jgi:hypothetical protein
LLHKMRSGAVIVVNNEKIISYVEVLIVHTIPASVDKHSTGENLIKQTELVTVKIQLEGSPFSEY